MNEEMFKKLIEEKIKKAPEYSEDIEKINEELLQLRSRVVSTLETFKTGTRRDKSLNISKLKNIENELLRSVNKEEETMSKKMDVDIRGVGSSEKINLPTVDDDADEISKSIIDNSLKILEENNKDIEENVTSRVRCIKPTKDITLDFLDYVENILVSLPENFVKSINWLGNTGISILTDISTTILSSPFTVATNVFQSLTDIPGIGVAARLINDTLIAPMKWFVDIGISSIEFISNGISTIFSVSMFAIEKTVSILSNGTAEFFKWYGNTIINTLNNPLNWIPGFFIIFFATELITISLRMLINTGSFAKDLFINFFGFTNEFLQSIWNIATGVFDWVLETVGYSNWGPGLNSTITSTLTFLLDSIFGDGTFDNVKEFLSKSIGYVKSISNEIIINISTAIDGVLSFITDFTNSDIAQLISSAFSSVIQSVMAFFERFGVIENTAKATIGAYIIEIRDSIIRDLDFDRIDRLDIGESAIDFSSLVFLDEGDGEIENFQEIDTESMNVHDIIKEYELDENLINIQSLDNYNDVLSDITPEEYPELQEIDNQIYSIISYLNENNEDGLSDTEKSTLENTLSSLLNERVSTINEISEDLTSSSIEEINKANDILSSVKTIPHGVGSVNENFSIQQKPMKSRQPQLPENHGEVLDKSSPKFIENNRTPVQNNPEETFPTYEFKEGGFVFDYQNVLSLGNQNIEIIRNSLKSVEDYSKLVDHMKEKSKNVKSRKEVIIKRTTDTKYYESDQTYTMKQICNGLLM